MPWLFLGFDLIEVSLISSSLKFTQELVLLFVDFEFSASAPTLHNLKFRHIEKHCLCQVSNSQQDFVFVQDRRCYCVICKFLGFSSVSRRIPEFGLYFMEQTHHCLGIFQFSIDHIVKTLRVSLFLIWVPLT